MSVSHNITIQRRVPPAGVPAPAALRQWALAALGHTHGELTIRIVDEAESAQLNSRYRGKDYPTSGFRQQTEQRLTIVDKEHPITKGLSDFDISDECYQCPMFEDSVHPLIRTSFKPVVESFAHGPAGSRVGAGHPPGSNMAAWVKVSEKTPVAYIQPGHDNTTWSNPNWRKLMLNAIVWAASPEAKAWAAANPTRIFA